MFTEEIYTQVNKWEGNGIDNDSKDLGGLTNSGITYTYYSGVCKTLFGKLPSVTHFKNLNKEEKTKLYENIWKVCLCDQITSNKVAVCVYDFAFNSRWAKREIQEALINLGYKITADNIFGQGTINAINRAISELGEEKVVDAIILKRIEYLCSLLKSVPANSIKFMNGWLNRIYDLIKFLNK